MDRISGVPQAILHDILGRLPDKDAAKTSVLSKSWRETWFSFPILSVCSKNFFTSHDSKLSPSNSLWLSELDIFIEYVRKRLTRLCDQGLAIKELKLDLKYILYHRKVRRHVDQWIQMASESGVEVLELCHTCDCMRKRYNLPLCIVKAKSLTKLVLTGEIRLDQAFLNHSLEFFSMKTLCLSYILFGGEGVMEHFISHCPLIECLDLDLCEIDNRLSIGDPPGSWVKSLSLHGLQKLKGAYIHGIQEVYVDAPNLENLFYHALSMHAPFKLNLDSCTNLRCLNLGNLRSPDEWLLELVYRNPFLESLMLHNFSRFEHERINISGPRLKFFRLSHFSGFKEVNVDAPNLLSCEYVGTGIPAISFMRISNKLELKVHFGMNKWNLNSFGEFVQNIKPQKLLSSLSLFIDESFSSRDSLGVLQVSSPPPSIKHVQLRYHMHNEAQYFPLMNWLLSSCFLETISISLNSCLNMKAFIVFFYEMLIDRKRCGCYLDSRLDKCCWHGLKVVKVTHSERPFENVKDLKAMLDALPEPRVPEFITLGLELESCQT